MNTDSVCAQRDRLYVVLSAGLKRDFVDTLFLLFVCLFTRVDFSWLPLLMLSKCLYAKKPVHDLCLCLLVRVFVGLLLQRTDFGSRARDGMREARGAAMCSTEAKKMPLTTIQLHHNMAVA